MKLKNIVKTENMGKYYIIHGLLFQLTETGLGELELVRMARTDEKVEEVFSLKMLLNLEGKEMKCDE